LEIVVSELIGGVSSGPGSPPADDFHVPKLKNASDTPTIVV
jgi:hypothetical protein